MTKSTIETIAINFGRLTGEPTTIKVYDLDLDRVYRLVTGRGWNVRLFNRDNPKPKGRGYGDREIWIYDPSDASGRFHEGERYAFAWRLLHELGHAETEKQAIEAFGPTKRGGRLGAGMTIDNAKQALWWEILAVCEQHAIAQNELGIRLDRVDLAREINTTLFDGMARIVTGEFLNPDDLGFVPFDTLPSWQTVIALLREFDDQAYEARVKASAV